MASLVAPLASGIAAAPSGSVQFFQQGTATPATVYSDPEGATIVTTHTLDAYGAIVRYVEERVDVVVLNVAAATVRTFTWGTDARDTRVENLGFTGTLPLGGTGAGGMTTVDAVLTKAFTSFGALDWKVDINGTPTLLATAIAGSAALVYNVTAAPYSATGDGATDDSAGVQAAINAAIAAGGGILYFPTGDYLLDSGITIGASEAKLTFLGDGVGASIIRQGTSGITMLSLGTDNEVLAQGITFTADSSANTGTLISVGTGTAARFMTCAFVGITGNIFLLGNSASSLVTCFGCLIGIAVGSASVRIATDSTAAAPDPGIVLVSCELALPAPGNTYFSNCRVGLVACTMLLGFAGASGTVVIADSSAEFQIVGGSLDCVFTSGTVSLGTSVTMSAVGAKFTSDTSMSLCGTGTNTLYEAGCHFDTNTFIGTISEGYSSTRDHRRTSTSGTAITYTPSGEYFVHEVTSANTTASMAFADPSPAVPPGSGLMIIWKNSSGGALTPTFSGSAFTNLVAPVSIANGNSAIFYYIPKGGTISTDLIGIGPQPATGVTL